jgi:hypothetical protein
VISIRLLLIVAFTLAPLGCGAGKASLSGKVLFKGRPVTQGSVSVYSETGAFASADIQPDGSYSIPECPTGKLKIAVSSPDPQEIAAQAATAKASGRLAPNAPEPPAPKAPATSWFSLDPRYANPDDSGLTVDVSAGDNEHDIILE